MRAALPVLLAAATLAACDGGGSTSTAVEAAQATTPPAQSGSIDFTTFTKELLRSQSDAAQPVAVNAARFVFADNDNPDAFASVLPGT